MNAFFAGALSLVGCLLLSAGLAADYLGGLALPGCGPESACARIAAGPWGHLPLLEWPLAFVGCAYFLGLSLAWARCRRAIPVILLHGIRLGALVSVGLTGVMLYEGLLCGYCLATHGAHLLFCIAAHRIPRQPSGGSAPLALLVVGVVCTSLGLYRWRTVAQDQVSQQQERELVQSMEAIAAAGTPAAANQGSRQARYPKGPEQAAVRIVVFSDYECEDCKRVHGDLERIVDSHDNVAVAAMHFPMCSDCNSSFATRNLHPNACWAARAAETAGMLHGADAFWSCSRWLFDNDGKFQKDELNAYLAREGYDAQAFRRTMEGDEVLARVQADIEEGLRRGLHFTPMVFINGLELHGALAPGAVPRAVEQILATQPEPASAAADVPQTALEKHVSDWRIQPTRSTAPERRTWRATPADARVQIVVWGDYQEQHTATADRILRNWANSHGNTSYVFRHFPAHSGCNTSMTQVMHANACILALAAETASVLGDETQYWQLHEWLFEHAEGVTPAHLLQTVSQLGFDAQQFEATMKSPAVADAIEKEGKQGFKMLYRGSIPAIYINGKVVPRWRLAGENVLETILEGLGAH